MTLQINTFDDLLEIINTHPDWRRKLVKALFPDLDLPKAIQELIEANQLLRAQLGDVEAKLAEIDARLGRLETHVEQIDHRLGHIEIRVDQIDARMGRMESHMDQMDTRMERMESRQERMESQQGQMNGRLINVERSVADLKGSSYENDVRTKAEAIFGYFLRRGRDVRHEVSLQLDQAEASGLISDDEYTQVMATDLLWRGRIKQQENTATLVVEVSWLAEQTDLMRAATRATILQRIGVHAFPVVVAREWPAEVRQTAQEQGVLVVEQFNLDRQSWQSTLAAATNGE